MDWQAFIISAWQSAIGLSERKHVAICSCAVAICARISLLGAIAGAGASAAHAVVAPVRNSVNPRATGANRNAFLRTMGISCNSIASGSSNQLG
jgi:hypothetical protein